MDTNVFQYVLMIAEQKSISAAARRLFMSQPALTKQLGKLEAELGFKVFDRSSKSLSVTYLGEIFLDYAMKYMEIEREFQLNLEKQHKNEKETIRIATTNRGGSFAGTYTALFLEKYPNISLEYLDMNAKKCEEALKEEKVDLAIYTDPVMSSELEYMPLEEDPLVFVVPKNSSMVREENLSNNSPDNLIELGVEKFRDPEVRYLLSTENHSLHHAEQAFFKKYRINPRNSLMIDYVDTRYAIACGGAGIVLVPFTTVEKSATGKDVVYCTVKGDNLYRYVVIAKKKGKQLSGGAEAVWRFMVGKRF